MGNQQAHGRRQSLESVIANSRRYKPLDIEWDTVRRGRCIRFDGKRMIKSYGSWGVCTPSPSMDISSSRCIGYEFEIEIMFDSHGKGSAVMMGFVDHSSISDTLDLDGNLSDIERDRRWTFQIGDGQKGLKSLNVLKGHDFADEDTFRLRVDFERREIELFYNGKSAGVLFQGIPLKTQLIPCLSLKNATVQLVASNIIEI